MIAGFIDCAGARAKLGVSRQRLHFLASTGRIPYVWVNKNRIYRTKDVDKLALELGRPPQGSLAVIESEEEGCN